MTNLSDLKKAPSDAAPVSGQNRQGQTRLISIDNGGTLTDFCVMDGERLFRTKTLTTPHDLSQCLIDGLKKVARSIYGHDDLQALLLSTQSIRYSTTQGTNALVQRTGPRVGILLGAGLAADHLRAATGAGSLLEDLAADRIIELGADLAGAQLEDAAVQAVNALSSAGANRLVVSFGGDRGPQQESALKRRLLRTFPPHLLGALPIQYAHELVDDDDPVRRTWTAIFNAFLHPAMERFLYSADHKLREQGSQRPLLVFRNDGYSGRVAKTIAAKTYSSGPRGGMEGAKALAVHYGFRDLLTMDVGGTTTDIGLVRDGEVRATRFGHIEGVETSFPLSDVVSIGAGGSSIFRVTADGLRVGPESVGSTPGPACFGLGGTCATMTDAFLLAGLLDPGSYFGGALRIDAERAMAVIQTNVAGPLDLAAHSAVGRMEAAWVSKIAKGLQDFSSINEETTLAAFGGAGPFVACRIAEAIGVSRVIIPGLAAVFSAFGIGFSDIGHRHVVELADREGTTVKAAVRMLTEQTRRSLFGEGFDLSECRLQFECEVLHSTASIRLPFDGVDLPEDLPEEGRIQLALTAVKTLPHAAIAGQFSGHGREAKASGARAVLVNGTVQDLPLFRVEDLQAGDFGQGPAVLEEAFFTARIDAGWSFEFNGSGDILLSRTGAPS